jgi:hypothetical protein
MPARCALHTEGAAGHTVAISAGASNVTVPSAFAYYRSEVSASRSSSAARIPTVAVAIAAWPFRPAFMDQLADGLAAAGIPHA